MAAMTLNEIADRLEIEDLLTRYATALDAKDWDTWASCFTPDAHIDYSAMGGIKGSLAEIRAWLEQVMTGFPMTQHLVTNRAVRIDGDKATCRSALFNPMGIGGGDAASGLVVFFEGGYYNDKLVRTADGWRIAERVEEATFSTRTDRVMLRVFGS